MSVIAATICHVPLTPVKTQNQVTISPLKKAMMKVALLSILAIGIAFAATAATGNLKALTHFYSNNPEAAAFFTLAGLMGTNLVSLLFYSKCPAGK